MDSDAGPGRAVRLRDERRLAQLREPRAPEHLPVRGRRGWAAGATRLPKAAVSGAPMGRAASPDVRSVYVEDYCATPLESVVRFSRRHRRWRIAHPEEPRRPCRRLPGERGGGQCGGRSVYVTQDNASSSSTSAGRRPLPEEPSHGGWLPPVGWAGGQPEAASSVDVTCTEALQRTGRDLAVRRRAGRRPLSQEPRPWCRTLTLRPGRGGVSR